ncbi:MAG: serine O-acetyltransferase [Fimbriimonadaceae bacterium]
MTMAQMDIKSRLELAQSDCDVPCQLRRESAAWLDRILGLMFPHLSQGEYRGVDLEWPLTTVLDGLFNLIVTTGASVDEARIIVGEFRDSMPKVLDELEADAELMHSLDPASASLDEVKLAYPGFYALAVYRVAQLLHGKVRLLPRVLTETGHRMTGIDIHPGAKIASPVAIDHGTGIVIGETAAVGRNVQIFQGVTLGAMSVKKSMAGTKRHPTVEDDVVIYAGATILGGETVVGAGSVIGGNVWLTESVMPGSLVTNRAEIDVKNRGQK